MNIRQTSATLSNSEMTYPILTERGAHGPEYLTQTWMILSAPQIRLTKCFVVPGIICASGRSLPCPNADHVNPSFPDRHKGARNRVWDMQQHIFPSPEVIGSRNFPWYIRAIDYPSLVC